MQRQQITIVLLVVIVALSNTTGASNSAMGHDCMEANTTGNNNSAFGF